jgi:hypothetical protein
MVWSAGSATMNWNRLAVCRSTASAALCPRPSLMVLNPSKSMNRMATHPALPWEW